MKKSIITLASLVCLSVGAFANADDHMRDHKHGPEHKPSGFSFAKILKDQDLGLSEQQKLQIKAIAKQTREDNSVFGGEKQEIRLQMRDLMNMPVWDAQFAREIISSQMENGKEIELNLAEARHKVYQVLTQEQKSALAAKAEQRDERKGERKGKGKNREGKMEARFGKALGLSDEQKTQWAAIKASSKALKASFRDEMEAHREQVKQVIQAESFDAEAFLALQNEFADSLLEHRVQMAQSKYQSFALLSDEQKEKMKEMTEKMKEKRRS